MSFPIPRSNRIVPRYFRDGLRMLLFSLVLGSAGGCADILGIPSTSASGDTDGQRDDAGSCASAPAGIVAWWDGEVLGVDIAGEHTSTTFRGDPVSVPGLVGNAIQFGLDDVIEIAAAPQPAMFTVEGWLFLTNQAPRWIGIYGEYRESSLCAYDNRLVFWEGTVGSLEDGNLALGETTLLGQWQHIAGTWDGTTFRTYVDGALETEELVPPGDVALPDVAQMGGLVDGGIDLVDRFAGLLDELTVYSRALAASEISAIAGAGAAGKCKGQ